MQCMCNVCPDLRVIQAVALQVLQPQRCISPAEHDRRRKGRGQALGWTCHAGRNAAGHRVPSTHATSCETLPSPHYVAAACVAPTAAPLKHDGRAVGLGCRGCKHQGNRCQAAQPRRHRRRPLLDGSSGRGVFPPVNSDCCYTRCSPRAWPKRAAAPVWHASGRSKHRGPLPGLSNCSAMKISKSRRPTNAN